MLKMSYPEPPVTAQDLTLIQWAPAPPLVTPSAPRPGCHHRDVAPTHLQHLGLGLVPTWFPRAELPINTLPGLQRGTSGEAEGPQLDPLALCRSWGHLGCVCSLMGRPVAAGQGRVPRGCPRVFISVFISAGATSRRQCEQEPLHGAVSKKLSSLGAPGAPWRWDLLLLFPAQRGRRGSVRVPWAPESSH